MDMYLEAIKKIYLAAQERFRQKKDAKWRGWDNKWQKGHMAAKAYKKLKRLARGKSEDPMKDAADIVNFTVFFAVQHKGFDSPQQQVEAIMFETYRRTNTAEMRPFVKGENLDAISVSDTDNPEEDMGMVARNPANHEDQWYVARKYFQDNFEKKS